MGTARLKIVLLAGLAAVVLGAAMPAAASAQWKFNGVTLVGSESVEGVAIDSSMAIPGATTTCELMPLSMDISNVLGAAHGEVTKLSGLNCTAGANCSVTSFGGEKTPWAVHSVVVGTKTYLVIEGMRIAIKYSGPPCSLGGTTVIVIGTAGGWFDNVTSTVIFDKSTFEATKTSLTVGTMTIEWLGAEFPMKALGTHKGEPLELG